MTRVLVTGGRDYADRSAVYRALDSLDVTELAHGACPYGGADILAEDWAKSREVPYRGYPARFKSDGRRAGPERNARQLDDFKPDVLLAFPGGRGTANCVAQAEARGITVVFAVAMAMGDSGE